MLNTFPPPVTNKKDENKAQKELALVALGVICTFAGGSVLLLVSCLIHQQIKKQRHDHSVTRPGKTCQTQPPKLLAHAIYLEVEMERGGGGEGEGRSVARPSLEISHKIHKF